MTTRPPHQVSIPAAIQKEVFAHLDGMFAPGIRDPNSHIEWVTLRAKGYRALVAVACLLHFAAIVVALFSFFHLKVDEHPDFVSVVAVFVVLGFAIAFWCHLTVFQLFMFRVGVRPGK